MVAAIFICVEYVSMEYTAHPRRDALLAVVGIIGCILAAYYVLVPAFINSRVFGIHTCIKAKQYIEQKPTTLYKATGCHTYRELYRYASQELYYTR